METKFVICLGREYGSGGRTIAKLLSGMLGVDYYDKKLLDKAARDSGIAKEYFTQSDERAPGSLAHSLAAGLFPGSAVYMYNYTLSGESIFKFQSETIQKLAEEKSCIIVGRCADYVLRKHKNVFTVFITAPLPVRVRKVSGREKIPAAEARAKAKKMDKARKQYYNYFTDKRWGHTNSYQLSIDSSVLGDEGTARYIRDFVLSALEKAEKGK